LVPDCQPTVAIPSSFPTDAGPTTAPIATSKPSLPAPYLGLYRRVATLLHYFWPLTLDAIRNELRLSYNGAGEALDWLVEEGYAEQHVEDDEHVPYSSTGRWDPETDERKVRL